MFSRTTLGFVKTCLFALNQYMWINYRHNFRNLWCYILIFNFVWAEYVETSGQLSTTLVLSFRTKYYLHQLLRFRVDSKYISRNNWYQYQLFNEYIVKSLLFWGTLFLFLSRNVVTFTKCNPFFVSCWINFGDDNWMRQRTINEQVFIWNIIRDISVLSANI